MRDASFYGANLITLLKTAVFYVDEVKVQIIIFLDDFLASFYYEKIIDERFKQGADHLYKNKNITEQKECY